LLPALEAHHIIRLLVNGSLFVGFVALSLLPLKHSLARIIHDT
jgi:hypothetical protein